MPSRRRPSNISPRKRVRRRSRGGPRKRARMGRPSRNLSLAAYRRGTGFPPTMKLRHTYVTTLTIAPPIDGSLYVLYVSCNGLFKPFGGDPTHQVMFFDQMSTLYDHYRVLGSKCTYSIIPRWDNRQVTAQTSNFTWTPFRVLYRLNDDEVESLTDPETIMENSGTRYFVVPPNTTKGAFKARLRYSPRKVFGKRVSIHDQQGTISSNPPEGHFYELGMHALDTAASQGATFVVSIRVDYLAVWSERKEVVNS